MARLHFSRAGFKPVGNRLDAKGVPIHPNGMRVNLNRTKKPLTKSVNPNKVNSFLSSLKPKRQIAFLALVEEIKNTPNIAMEDIIATAHRKQKLAGRDFGPTSFYGIFREAQKAGVIITK